MTRLRSLLRRLRASREGVAAIETALVTPVLVTLALGSFEVSNIIASRSELQGTMAEVSGIALASEPTSPTRRATLKAIIQESTGLPAEDVTVDAAYRCGVETQMRTTTTSCGASRISSYVKIVLTDSYVPVWTEFGVGSPVEQTLTRFVMIKQQTTSS